MTITRNTRAKERILEIILASDRALSQSDVFGQVDGLCDRVTVYRVLDRLVSEKKIHKIVNVDGIINYAGCSSCDTANLHQHDHLHFSCVRCKKLSCLENHHVDVTLPLGYAVQELFLTISGICPSCG